MIKYLFFLFFSIQINAQVMTDSPRNLNIPSNLIIYLSNPSTASLSMALTLSNPNFDIEINRCPSILLAKKSCYIIVTAKSQLLTYGLNSSQILNSGVEIGIVTKNSLISSTSSIAVQSSSLNFGTITNLGKTSSKMILITNTGSSILFPIVSVSGLEIFLLTLVVAIIAATLSFKYYESFFMKLKTVHER